VPVFISQHIDSIFFIADKPIFGGSVDSAELSWSADLFWPPVIGRAASRDSQLDQRFNQGSCRSLKVHESPWIFFLQILKPGKSLKTDIVLESPWICVWRSLKVLEFDFLKRCDRTSWYWKKVFQMASFWPQMCITRDLTGGAYDTYICLWKRRFDLI